MDDKNAEPEAPPKTVSAKTVNRRALGVAVLAFAAATALPYAFINAAQRYAEHRLFERHVFVRTPEGYKPVATKPAHVPLSEVFELHCNRPDPYGDATRSEVYVGPLRAQYEVSMRAGSAPSRYTYFSVDMGPSNFFDRAAGHSLAALPRDDRSLSGMSLSERDAFGALINNACNNAAIGYPVAGDIARIEGELIRITAEGARRNAEKLQSERLKVR